MMPAESLQRHHLPEAVDKKPPVRIRQPHRHFVLAGAFGGRAIGLREEFDGIAVREIGGMGASR